MIVSGTHSGVGKTTVMLILLHALRRYGFQVQAFKIGPDFIDTAYHTEATGRPSINLDEWMLGKAGIRDTFDTWSAESDISVIEALGALFDGNNGRDQGSAAATARFLGIPVVLVIDIWGMTRTTAAIMRGMLEFDPKVRIAACILNRAGSPTHASMVMNSLPKRLRKLVVGYVLRHDRLQINERHLGLITVEENHVDRDERFAYLQQAAENLDIPRMLSLVSKPVKPVDSRIPKSVPRLRPQSIRTTSIRIAIARDSAFCFYYEDNLRILGECGVEFLPFSPLHDQRLPIGTQAIYLGGGYPESFAAKLASNTSLLDEFGRVARREIPILAECGGMMYLCRSLTGFDQRTHTMSGILPIDVAMDREYLAIRYVDISTRVKSPLGIIGTHLRGQEFHQSRIVHTDLKPNLFDVTTSTNQHYRDGYCLNRVVASYFHIHFRSNPKTAVNFVNSIIDSAS
jgi:cobyrinic acid a,c-diamide synthase